MNYVLDAYCGVFCGACLVMLATKTGKLEEDKSCFGCKSEKPTRFCKTCRIKACATSKGFEFCFECSKLTTCDLMQNFIADKQYPYGLCVSENLKVIQTKGLGNWQEMQVKRWRCEYCGEPYSWYQETCTKCGFAVKNYLADL